MSLELILTLLLGLILIGLQLYLALKPKEKIDPSFQLGLERLERELRQELAQTRQEQTQTLGVLQQTLGVQQNGVTQQLTQQLGQLTESNARRMLDVRDALDKQLEALQKSNSTKLDEMRQTVDEKLQATLQARLGESFKQVADRLEQVHKGLGEMQSLAQGVGDLKHLLTNVKTRGIFGEAQLGALIEQIFVAEQYGVQVATKPGSRERVDYAIKMPGRAGHSPAGQSGYDLAGGMAGDPEQIWLPIDAKFPTEDFERLLDAQERADAAGVEVAGKALEIRIRAEAKSISEKYIAPPYTTDFAILFLPSEALYAEVLRRAGLMDTLQREYRITLAGPTTLLAMLNSLQMGFRTLALEKRSSEVWQVLGAVKTEFGKFGDVLAKVKAQTQTVLNTLDNAETRSRAMERALKTVEAMPEGEAQKLLPED